MGMDLMLLPDTFGDAGEGCPIFADVRLRVGRDYQVFDSIDALKPRRLCQPILHCEDGGLVERESDPYGKPLTYVTAGELREDVDPGDSVWTRAAWAWLGEVRGDLIIVLWWH